ncbi:SGNH/GDSL hydrolase family protein [Marimonas sp. MJW-29]|uniref:SGNH/GDSL hydrolase family protein n=1 Tax=Sulfitobacter sediminis TaxID=3234186 RepID=A0ABV3RWJ2_9RHOB
MEDDTLAQPAYTALFVFGDSLSDNGAVFALTEGALPPTELIGIDLDGNPVDFTERGIFYNGRYTNGDVYADVAAHALGIPGDTSTFYDDFSGSNLAIGGATASDLTAIGDSSTNTFANQVSTFQGAIASLPGTDASKQAFLSGAAASVFIGLNDLGAIGGASTATGVIDQAVISTGVAAILEQLFAQTQVIADSGVGTIILNKLPGGSFFPNANPLIDAFGPGTAELFDQVSAQVNAGIESLATTLQASGTSVEIVDFFGLAKEIQNDQETFGFLTLENALPDSNNSTTLLIDDVPINQIGFIDPVHFTAELHEVFDVFQAMTIGNAQIDGGASGGITSGSAANETIFAKEGRDRVRAEDGDDLIFAGADNDVVFAGEGADIVFGGTGNDVLIGEAGKDILSGGDGRDILLGEADDDVIAGNAGNDFVNGGAGDDVLTDGLGSDVVFGGSGDDIVIYRAASTLGGTDGADEDVFFGGSGADTLLIISDTAIADIDAFLLANNVELFDFETVTSITSDELETYDFGAVGTLVETADLFGLI